MTSKSQNVEPTIYVGQDEAIRKLLAFKSEAVTAHPYSLEKIWIAEWEIIFFLNGIQLQVWTKAEHNEFIT